MPYYTYILRCEDGSLYTGISSNLSRRFSEHCGTCAGGAKYTASHQPTRYEAAWESAGRSEASKLEHLIKTLSRADKERLIGGTAVERINLTSYTRIMINDRGKIIMQYLCYPKCSTCKKTQAFLDEHNIQYDLRDIKQDKPSEAELRAWHRKSGLPLKRFFNSSGTQYKALELSKKLSDMSEDEQFSLLATDGMLVKRPILIGESFVLVGFRQAEWEEKL